MSCLAVVLLLLAVSPARAENERKAQPAPVDEVYAAVWCDSAEAWAAVVTRIEACIHGITLAATATEIPTGAPLGGATFEVSHDIRTSATSLVIEDDAAVT